MANITAFDASHRAVKSVTIFSSRKAEVVREFEVELQKGQNEVKISSLPSCIDAESARVTGLDDAVLFDVVCAIGSDEPQGVDKRSEVLKELERKKAVLLSTKHVLGQQADMLTRVGFSLSAENNNLGAINDFLDNYIDRSTRTLGDANELERQIGELDKEILQERHKEVLNQRRAAAYGSVKAIIMAKKPGKVLMKLTYMVSGAAWNPSYDLHAATEGGKPPKTVTLHYRATIVQNTGEDWEDASISLSTADPGSIVAVPYARPQRIVPSKEPSKGLFRNTNNNVQFQTNAIQQQQQQQQQGALFGNAPPQPRSLFGAAAPAGLFGSTSTVPASTTLALGTSFMVPQPTGLASSAPGGFGSTAPAVIAASEEPPQATAAVPPAPPQFSFASSSTEGVGAENAAIEEEKVWDGKTTTVSESAVSSSFRIDDSCTIPSDGRSHNVIIAIIPFEATVYYYTVPRLRPVAFLQCSVTNTSEYRLLPGTVTVYVDDSPVSKRIISECNPEERFHCTMGPDQLLRVKFARLPIEVKTVGSAFAAKTTSTTYKYNIRIQNTHTFAVKGLQIDDTIPLPSSGDQHQHGGEDSVDSQQIKVLLKEPEGLSDATGITFVDAKNAKMGKNSSAKARWGLLGGEKTGKYEWQVDVAAGDEVSLPVEYEVRAPSDFKWSIES